MLMYLPCFDQRYSSPLQAISAKMSKLGDQIVSDEPVGNGVSSTSPIKSKATSPVVEQPTVEPSPPSKDETDDFERLRPVGSEKSATRPTKLEDLSLHQQKILDKFRDSLKKTLGDELRSTLDAHKARGEAVEKDRLPQGVDDKGLGVVPLPDEMENDQQRILRDALIKREQEEIEARQKEEKERLVKGLAELDLAAKQAKAKMGKGEAAKAGIETWLDSLHGDDAWMLEDPKDHIAPGRSGSILQKEESLQPDESIDEREKRLAQAAKRLARDLKMVEGLRQARLELSTGRRNSVSDRDRRLSLSEESGGIDRVHSVWKDVLLERARSEGIDISSLEQTTIPTLNPTDETSSSAGIIEATEAEIRANLRKPLMLYLGLGPKSAVGSVLGEEQELVEVHHAPDGAVYTEPLKVPVDQYIDPDNLARRKALALQHATETLKEYQRSKVLSSTELPITHMAPDTSSSATISTPSSPSSSPANGSSVGVSPAGTPASSVAGSPTSMQPVGLVEPTVAGPKLGEADRKPDDDIVSLTGSDGGDDGDKGEKGDKDDKDGKGGISGDEGASELGEGISDFGGDDVQSRISDDADDTRTVVTTV